MRPRSPRRRRESRSRPQGSAWSRCLSGGRAEGSSPVSESSTAWCCGTSRGQSREPAQRCSQRQPETDVQTADGSDQLLQSRPGTTIPGSGKGHQDWCSFDSVSQDWLVRFLEHRIGDPRIVRLIQKWLKAGILEEGSALVTGSDVGAGQGSVISPLLANVYLHYVFDLWAERWRRREAGGDMIIVRYADDLVVGFEHEADARRFWDAMRMRLEAFALTLHPDKTRLIEFGRHAAARRAQRGLGKPETFRFLGFTHVCGRSRRGTFQLQRKSRADRMRATLRRAKDALRRPMHQPIPVQGRWLTQVVNGYFAYHAVPTNRRALMAFRHHVTDLWRRTLRRRSQKDRLTWARMAKLADAWLPRPHLLHPWPSERFAVRHPRWEPDARMGPVRIWCSEASCHSCG